MLETQLFSVELPGILPAGRRAGRAALAVLLLVWLSVAGAAPATAQGNPYAMIGPVPMVEYAMPFERMPRLVNADTTGDTAAMLIDGYGGKIYYVDAADSILGTAELPEDAVLMWLSVDPMTDKYPGVSPYAYCAWNPVKIIDPDGREGVQVINMRENTITVKASYYVRTSPLLGMKGSSYNPSDVQAMQNDVNAYLNSQNFTYDVNGVQYTVIFELCFSDAGDQESAILLAGDDFYCGFPIGNTLSKLSPSSVPHLFDTKDNGDGTISTYGGVTAYNNQIIMNAKYDNTRSRMHEIFHTLFFNRDGASSGIGNYVPGIDMPNQSDINQLLNNKRLPVVYE